MSDLEALFKDFGDTMTVDELAALLRVRKTTLYENFRTGRLPAYKVGRDWLIVTAEIKDHLRANRNSYPR